MDRKPTLGGKGAIKQEEERKMATNGAGNEAGAATTTGPVDPKSRVLVGVMRVGLLAKQLLLR